VLVGITLPTFTAEWRRTLSAACAAEAADIDGVFVFDHLWPLGGRGRPALWSFSVLAAVAAVTDRVRLGPLVGRIGLLPDDDLVATFESLAAVAGRPRLIAGIGAGDSLSAPENRAYGLGYPSAAERLATVAQVADRLARSGLETWVGGSSDAAMAVAGGHAHALNVWGVGVEGVRRAAGALAAHASSVSGHVPPAPGGLGGRRSRVIGHAPQLTWAGPCLVGRCAAQSADLRAAYGARPGLVSGTVDEVADHVRALGEGGAVWCVLAPLDYHADPVGAVETISKVAEAVR